MIESDIANIITDNAVNDICLSLLEFSEIITEAEDANLECNGLDDNWSIPRQLKIFFFFPPLDVSDFDENWYIGLFYLANLLVKIKVFCTKHFFNYSVSKFFFF